MNGHLGTAARTLVGVVEQLGIARFGHSPVVGDPFCGGGSIPFEAARLGADVVASDLNPVAAMLTWGALNIIGADAAAREAMAREQQRVAEAVDVAIVRLGIEHDALGNRAKAYLYCTEVVDPQTGWKVPLAPSWVISRNRHCVAVLVPDNESKSFTIDIVEDATPAQMQAAKLGTFRDGHLVYTLPRCQGREARTWRIAIARLRGDAAGPVQPDGSRGNSLRPWEIDDIIPRPHGWDPDAPTADGTGAWEGGDLWQERLYCIQWMSAADLRAGKRRPETFFRAPGADDVAREQFIAAHVQGNLATWQADGLVPDMRIELGAETTRLTRERGWTYWHHLFTPRHLLTMKAWKSECDTANAAVIFASILDRISRLSRWAVGYPGRTGVAPSADQAQNVFYNQAFNTIYTHAARSAASLADFATFDGTGSRCIGQGFLQVGPAGSVSHTCSLWVYDPPYADAVNYHEITEYFIAWLRKNPPSPLDKWTWDSRRPLAIQGKGEKFRTDMVAAFRGMQTCMPDNGMQVCMFTHKDAGVWADMAGIVWAAGLRVTAAWYVSTETTSELKHGGYVQGTVLLVLRKRAAEEHGYRSDIVPEVRARVAAQVETLTGLNQSGRGRGRDENLFSDADIQMAGYAAALEVLTGYTHIDGADMTREALRPRQTARHGQKVEIGIVEEMIALAVQTANEMMVPDGFPDGMWDRLSPAERFYLKMTAAEAEWPVGSTAGKLDDYQNFAKAYRVEGWEDLMADRTPNRARLKSATEFRGAFLSGQPISPGSLRPTLYAVMGLARNAEREVDPEVSGSQALHDLRDHFGDAEWIRARDNIRVLAGWLGRTWQRRSPGEAAAARVLASLVTKERL